MRAYTRPMLITDMGEQTQDCSALEPLPFKSDGGQLYTEAWLQGLIQRHPLLLPVDQIEPALTPLIPVCVELPIPSGYVDNLFLTPDGGIVLVETKLWRNPEARRAVIGQVLEYAKALSRWSYSDLQAAVRIACKDQTLSLFAHVCGPQSLAEEEVRFIDAVSRNLRLGRVLMIIAGDGIQESAEELIEFMQSQLGLHFTLALVEISLWRAPQTGQVFVQPKILARTVQIERAVVRLEPGVALEPMHIMPASAGTRPTTISAETFYEILATVDPTLPARLKAFLKAAEPLGVYPDIKKNLSLKWRASDGREFSLGNIDHQGLISTDFVHWNADQIGRVDLSHAYQDRLVSLIPGASVRKTPKPVGWRAVLGSQNIPVAALLDHQQDWLDAIGDYIAQVRQTLEPDPGVR